MAKKSLVLHKDSWNVCVKTGSKFQIIHADDFESPEEFKQIKVGDKIDLEDHQVWWSIPMRTLKGMLKKT